MKRITKKIAAELVAARALLEAYRPNLRPWIDQQAEDSEGITVADGFDDALVGVTAYQPGRPVCAVYNYEKCVKCLLKQNETWTDEDAREWMEFNVVGAWVGDGTPVFLVEPTHAELLDALPRK